MNLVCLFYYMSNPVSLKGRGFLLNAGVGGSLSEASAGLCLSHVNSHLDYNIFQLYSLLGVDYTEKHHHKGMSYWKCANALV